MMERLDFDLLFRWFVGLGIEDAVWHSSVYAKNRERLFATEVAERFLTAILERERVKPLLSREHFSVDGTLIQAWASMASFQPVDGENGDDNDGEDSGDGGPTGPRNMGRNFRGERRSNQTHTSTTDPDARLFRKAAGQASQLAYMGHVLTENRYGLVVDVRTTRAHGRAERMAALDMLEAQGERRWRTLGADKGYDTKDFVAELREQGVTPHVARNVIETPKKRRRSAIDERTTRHPGYAASQKARKRVEEVFGWMKTAAGLRQTRHRRLDRVAGQLAFAAAAYNLVRLPRLLGASP
jgi:IS5 family transposase